MGLTVWTVEHLEGDHGLHTWPCAPVLAQYVYTQRERLKGKRVVELGAGTAVPGIVAATCGAKVILTDREEEGGTPRLLDNLRRTCELNCVPVVAGGTSTAVVGGAAAAASVQLSGTGRRSQQQQAKGEVTQIMALSWGVFSPELLALPPQDVVLASDCFYDSKDFEDILTTVSYFMAKNPRAEFWTTYQDRSSDRSLLPLLQRWDMKCKSVPLGFYPGAEGERVRVEGLSERINSSPHTIHMWEVTKMTS